MTTQYLKLQTLRDAFQAALTARDAIESCATPEWRAAHAAATAAWEKLDVELRRLAKVDRYGAWATVGECELMLKGYL